MVFIVGDTLRHQPMVVGHMAVPQFRGPITYCVLQWCHPMLTGTQRRTSCSTRMITLYGDHVIKLDSGPHITIGNRASVNEKTAAKFFPLLCFSDLYCLVNPAFKDVR